MRHILTALLLATTSMASAATYDATPQTLLAVAGKAAPGDTITVTGVGTQLTLPRKTWVGAPLTLEMGGATYKSAYLLQVGNVRFNHFNLQSDPLPKYDAQAVRVVQGSDLVFSDCHVMGAPATNGVPFTALKGDATGNVIGLPAGKGFNFDSTKRVTIQRCEIANFHKAIVFSYVDDMTIVDNQLHTLRSTPISGAVGDNLHVERNHTWDSKPWRFGASMADGGDDGDHGDTLHVWTSTKPVLGLVVRDNTFEAGPMLGIYLDDNGKRFGFVDAVVERNHVIGGHAEGILLEYTTGTVAENQMEWNGLGDAFHNSPRIYASASSRDLQLRCNEAVNFTTPMISINKIPANLAATIQVTPCPGKPMPNMVSTLAPATGPMPTPPVPTPAPPPVVVVAEPPVAVAEPAPAPGPASGSKVLVGTGISSPATVLQMDGKADLTLWASAPKPLTVTSNGHAYDVIAVDPVRKRLTFATPVPVKDAQWHSVLTVK